MIYYVSQIIIKTCLNLLNPATKQTKRKVFITSQTGNQVNNVRIFTIIQITEITVTVQSRNQMQSTQRQAGWKHKVSFIELMSNAKSKKQVTKGRPRQVHGKNDKSENHGEQIGNTVNIRGPGNRSAGDKRTGADEPTESEGTTQAYIQTKLTESSGVTFLPFKTSQFKLCWVQVLFSDVCMGFYRCLAKLQNN